MFAGLWGPVVNNIRMVVGILSATEVHLVETGPQSDSAGSLFYFNIGNGNWLVPTHLTIRLASFMAAKATWWHCTASSHS